MRLIRCLSDFKASTRGLSLAIGNFDGMHLGHQAVLAEMIKRAKAKDLIPSVMIFEPHPLEFFMGDRIAPARLFTLRDKLRSFAANQVELVLCMRFDRSFGAMSASSFVTDLLAKKLGVKSVTVGTLFNFGQGGKAGINELADLGAKVGIEAQAILGVNLGQERISSTLIRAYLKAGRLADAASALGRPYAICGRVVRGNAVGNTIGYPTANVNLHRRSCPLNGAYAVKVKYLAREYEGMANVGWHPTVKGGAPKALLEVNLFDFNDDLYGKSLEVVFYRKIRDEFKFSDLEGLKQRLADDKLRCRQFFAQNRVPQNFN